MSAIPSFSYEGKSVDLEWLYTKYDSQYIDEGALES